ncbi:MAG: hypothetical protein KAT56_06090 [Sedimentisphaerales bacterium]|nr:hypothetical protein [Sedimentisphaerales bacterium]
MYVLKPDEFCNYDLSNINQFINLWNRYYDEEAPGDVENNEAIDYINELNLGNSLTRENIIRLVTWKGQWQTNQITDFIDNNNDALNKFKDFRNCNPEENGNENDFKRFTSRIFHGGTVIRIFLFHICKPYKYPIIDQHVVRTYNCHMNAKFNETLDLDRNWEHYLRYRKYFFEIANAYYNHDDDYEWNQNDTKRLKRIDNALMAFGQFLKKYDNVAE